MDVHEPVAAALTVFAVLATACSEHELPSELADETSTSSGDTGFWEQTPEMDPEPELVIELLVNGEPQPDPVLSAQIVELSAEHVGGASPLVSLELSIDGEPVANDFELSDTYALLLADATDNGTRVLTVRAQDRAGNIAQDTVSLSVAMPEHGETVWDLQLDDGPAVGLVIGADDSSLLITEHALHTIDAAGVSLDVYELYYSARAIVATPDGDVIVLGTDSDDVVYNRFDATGTPTRLDTLVGEAPPVEDVWDAHYGDDDQLLAIWTYGCGLLPCQELVRLNHASGFSVDASTPLERDGMNPYAIPPTLEVGPDGDIYIGAVFPFHVSSLYLQAQRVNQALEPVWVAETMSASSAYFSDSVTTSTGFYLGGRLEERAAIAHYDLEGNDVAVYELEGDEVLQLAEVGDDIVYASRVEDMGGSGMQLGRLRPDGELLWSVMSERGAEQHEEARALQRDSLGHVHVLSALGPGRSRLQRVAL